MSKLDTVSEEVFRILRSYNYEVVMYDDEGTSVFEPKDGRRFYAKKANILVSVSDEGEDSSINLYLSKSTAIGTVLGLINALRTCATKYNMIYDGSRNFKADFEPKVFASKSTVREAKETMTDLTEGMYGTSRSSYLKLENARMIVRHSKAINEDSTGARSRNIDRIFVENSQQERYLMPTRQLSAGRAMTQHFNHGGSFADEVGSQIQRMTQDFADLGACQSYCSSNAEALAESAQAVSEGCASGRKAIKETFSRLFRESSYAETAAGLRESAASPVLVEDAVIQNLREMLTVEGKELKESMLEAVARHYNKADRDLTEAEPATADGPKKREETFWNEIALYPEDHPKAGQEYYVNRMKILGIDVLKQAWMDFAARKLELAPALTTNHNLKFADARSRVAYELDELAERCIEPSMANLLNRVAEVIQERPKGVDMASYLSVAQHALAIARSGLSESFGLGFRGVKAIRELEEWFNTTLPWRVLAESPYPDDFRGVPGDDNGHEQLEAMMPEIMLTFDSEELASELNPGASELEVRDAIDRRLRSLISERDVDLSIGATLTDYVDDLLPSVMAHLPLDEEAFDPMLDPGEEFLSEEDFDDGFDDEAAREIIADLVQKGHSEGKAHNFTWDLKMAEEHRDTPAEVAYLARQIRDGHSEGHHPRWVLKINPMLLSGEFMEGDAGRVYYTLAVRDGGQWAPQFGSYDKTDVVAERQSERDRGVPATDLKIVRSDVSQASVNAAIAKLNEAASLDESELTREDVLLPKDQGVDLKGEILTKPEHSEPDLHGDKMISDLTRLAGLKR